MIDKIFDLIGFIFKGLIIGIIIILEFIFKNFQYVFFGIFALFYLLLVYIYYFPPSKKPISNITYSQTGSGLCNNYYDRAIDGSLCGKRASNPNKYNNQANFSSKNPSNSIENKEIVKQNESKLQIEKEIKMFSIQFAQDMAIAYGYDYGLYAETYSNETCKITADIFIKKDENKTELIVNDCNANEIEVKKVTYYTDDTLDIIDTKSRSHKLKIIRMP